MRRTIPTTRRGEAGFVMVEMSGSMLVYLILFAAGALLVYSLFSSGNLATTQQGLMSLRMQVQQLYSGGSDYNGLDNSLAMKAGLVPKTFLRGSKVVTPWGGEVALAASGDGSSFTISLSEIPQEECTKLATSQLDSWTAVSVNGNAIDKSSGTTTAAQSCNDSNTLVFTSR
ncbi:MAG: pilus assembly protein PilS [Desulfovibrio sp.]|jgi:hypothetical protein|nr:pilus assembly protein PilS [Desulfovibrio sp.]